MNDHLLFFVFVLPVDRLFQAIRREHYIFNSYILKGISCYRHTIVSWFSVNWTEIRDSHRFLPSCVARRICMGLCPQRAPRLLVLTLDEDDPSHSEIIIRNASRSINPKTAVKHRGTEGTERASEKQEVRNESFIFSVFSAFSVVQIPFPGSTVLCHLRSKKTMSPFTTIYRN